MGALCCSGLHYHLDERSRRRCCNGERIVAVEGTHIRYFEPAGSGPTSTRWRLPSTEKGRKHDGTTEE
jgi:hypothetical protein